MCPLRLVGVISRYKMKEIVVSDEEKKIFFLYGPTHPVVHTRSPCPFPDKCKSVSVLPKEEGKKVVLEVKSGVKG